MNVQTESSNRTQGEPPLVAFEGQLSEFCRKDQYKEMAESFSAFVKSHSGIAYLAFEPIPAKVGDHLIKKTQSPSAFMTFTLRRPTWTNELNQALSDPAAFQACVESFEADVIEIAKQAKKLN